MFAGAQRRQSHRIGVVVAGGLARGWGLDVLDRRRGRIRGAAAQSRQFVELREIAADAEAAVAAEHPLAVEHRQAGQFHGEALGIIIDRPGDGEAAPGVVRRQRPRDALVGIEVQIQCEVGPDQSQRGGGARPHQCDEFLGIDREAFVLVDLPDEAQRMPARIDGRGRSANRGRRLHRRRGRLDLGYGRLDGRYRLSRGRGGFCHRRGSSGSGTGGSIATRQARAQDRRLDDRRGHGSHRRRRLNRGRGDRLGGRQCRHVRRRMCRRDGRCLDVRHLGRGRFRLDGFACNPFGRVRPGDRRIRFAGRVEGCEQQRRSVAADAVDGDKRVDRLAFRVTGAQGFASPPARPPARQASPRRKDTHPRRASHG